MGKLGQKFARFFSQAVDDVVTQLGRYKFDGDTKQ